MLVECCHRVEIVFVLACRVLFFCVCLIYSTQTHSVLYCILSLLCVQVSSKVHNQLLKIADERAQGAEQKAVQLERQVMHLHSIHTCVAACMSIGIV